MWPEANIDVERIPILIREYKGRLKFVSGDIPAFLYEPKQSADNVIQRAESLVESLSTLMDEEQ
jgi:hypothetical protein